jgi:chaperone required for assembly of F1-ATPase
MAQEKGELERRPRRFYKVAAVVPAEGGWGVQLDGKPLRTPEKKMFVLPAEPLARAVAAEWEAQARHIDFSYMHAFRLANVALDRTPQTRAEMEAEAARYAGTDLLCHLADAPQELVQLQESAWSPLRVWAGQSLGVELQPTTGILPVAQSATSIEAVRRHAASLDDFRLTGLVHAVSMFGSALLGLAVERGRIAAVEAHELARIDEAFQARLWGEDAEAAIRAGHRRDEARALDVWFGALV